MPRRICLRATLAIIFVLPVVRVHSRSNDQCFPSVPDCLQGRFAQYWQSNGALLVFGYPLTPAFDTRTRDGLVMAQMMERNRLEYHPELKPPYDILLGRLGEDALAARGRNWRNATPGAPQVGCWFAETTRHTVCDQEPGVGFLTFYRSYGLDLGDAGVSEREALALWGMPLTEPEMETNAAGDTVLTQWFERARFEYHPEQPAPYRVLLGLLGAEVWGSQPRPPVSSRPFPPALAKQPAPRPAAPAVSSTPTPSSTPSPTKTPRPAPTSLPSEVPPLPSELAPTSPTPSTSPSNDIPTPMPSSPSETRTPTSSSPTKTRTPTPTLSSFPTTPTSTPSSPSTTRTPTPTPVSTSASSDEELKQRLFALADAVHQQTGCAPFIHDERLDAASQAHAADIAAHKRISHVGTDGATLRQRLDRVGYPYLRASESIGVYRTPEEVVRFWMAEPPNGPHRLNLTNCQYTDTGVGLAYDSGGRRWWVMDYTSRRQ